MAGTATSALVATSAGAALAATAGGAVMIAAAPWLLLQGSILFRWESV